MLTRERFLQDLAKFPKEFTCSPEIKKLILDVIRLPPGSFIYYPNNSDKVEVLEQ